MRLVCWNVNGLRTLRSYAPWDGLPTLEACLEALQADIACFQEVKMTHRQLTYAMCVMEAYDAYYDLHPTKGYAGTATYVRRAVCMPRDAQVGITGLGQDLDAEGRCVVLDCGLFVLLNVYAPNETDAERLPYKMAFYRALEERVSKLIKEGREVLVVGDMNVVADALDHCEGAHLPPHAARVWFRQWLAPHGALHDVTRRFHPERKNMYTCWSTQLDARRSNYGSRIDYTLATQGLLRWIRYADIQPHVYGSDHCPIYVDLHDHLDGESLADVIRPGTEAPRLAASHQHRHQPRLDLWTVKRAPETRASRRLRPRQTKLDGFVRRPPPSSSPPPPPPLPAPEPHPQTSEWSALFTPRAPPLCTVHREPAISRRVTKPGVNHGRTFWMCARPVGPGYAQQAVTPYRCRYFAWDTDVRRRR